jgi:hypothetical protein
MIVMDPYNTPVHYLWLDSRYFLVYLISSLCNNLIDLHWELATCNSAVRDFSGWSLCAVPGIHMPFKIQHLTYPYFYPALKKVV